MEISRKVLTYGLVLAILCCREANSRIYNQRIGVPYNMEQADWYSLYNLMDKGFGFLEQGEVHFSMECPTPEPYGPPQIWLLFCSTNDARELLRLSPNQLLIYCRRLSEGPKSLKNDAAYCIRQRVEHNTSLQDGRYSYHKVLEYAYFYRVILLNCPDTERDGNITGQYVRTCQSTSVALNPHGVHLGSDEIPLPLMYTVINLIWAILMAAWFYNWVTYFKFSNRLHRLISCAPIFKVILVVLDRLWWRELASTGMVSGDIAAARHFVQSIEEALLFITLMVIAEGWGIVRCSIKRNRWVSLLVLFLVFATSLLCVQWVHKYFLAFSFCCVVFMMYKSFKWRSHNIELLRRRRRKIRRFITRYKLRYKGPCTIDMQLGQKLTIYHRFYIAWASVPMVYPIAATLANFLHEYTYIKVLLSEIPELLVYLVIGVLFRLRNFEPYENIELVPPKEDVVVFELPGCCLGEVQPNFLLGVPLRFKVEKETQTPRRRWRTGIK